MTYAGYIAAAYAATGIVLVGLVLWVTVDLRVQRRRLARLDQRGLARRPGSPR